jgi:hypothetical protein
MINEEAGVLKPNCLSTPIHACRMLPLLQHAKLPHPIRTANRDIAWTMDKVVRNKKHFAQ